MGVVGCGEGVVYLTSYITSTDIDVQLGRAILVAGKSRGGMFLFLLFLHFHSCSFFFLSLSFISSIISSVSFLPFSERRYKMTHTG